MKTLNLASCLLVLLFSFSCVKQDYLNDVSRDEFNVSYETVAIYVKAKFGLTKSDACIKTIVREKDTLAYIVSHDKGWELLSADSRCEPIIAKGVGSFEYDNLNPNQKLWLDMELDEINEVKKKGLSMNSLEFKQNAYFWNKIRGELPLTKAEGDPIEDNQYWELVEILEGEQQIETSGHLITTKWGQSYPWNYCVPISSVTGQRCYTGCVAVSGAQMFKFIHDTLGKPNMFYTFGECVGNEYNHYFTFSDPSSMAWGNMSNSLVDGNSLGFNQVSVLMGWVGNEIGMSYGHNGSGAYMEDLRDLFQSQNIQCNYGNYNKNVVLSSLKNRMPVIASAAAEKYHFLGFPYYDICHSWIIDGYVTTHNTYYYIYEWTSNTQNELYQYGETKRETVVEVKDYILMNWGYDGSGDNGWYYPGMDWYEPTTNITYKYNKKIIYNFN